eukprot:984430-Pleurochrysis_carterae.AAC.2
MTKRVVEEHQVGGVDAVHLIEPAHEHLHAVALVDARPIKLFASLRVLLAVAQKVDEVARVARVGRAHGPEARLEHAHERGAEEVAVGLVDQLVAKDARALVHPEREQRRVGVEYLVHWTDEDALEHAREVAQAEDVVELGGSRQHLGLDRLPQLDRHLDQLLRYGPYVGCRQPRIGIEVSSHHRDEDLVDRGDARHRHVDHVEVALRAVRDVVVARAWVRHRCDEEQVRDCLPLARLVQIVKPAKLHQLAHDLECDLISPLID